MSGFVQCLKAQLRITKAKLTNTHTLRNTLHTPTQSSRYIKHMSNTNYTNNTPDHIATTRCDSCGRHGPAVLLSDNNHPGVIVLAECAACNGPAFEDQSRYDIETWLAGGQIYLGAPDQGPQ